MAWRADGSLSASVSCVCSVSHFFFSLLSSLIYELVHWSRPCSYCSRTLPVFVPASPARRGSPLVNVSAGGGEQTTRTPPCILCPLEGEAWRVFQRAKSFVFVVFSLPGIVYREKRETETKRENTSKKTRFSPRNLFVDVWVFFIWAIVPKKLHFTLLFYVEGPLVSINRSKCSVFSLYFTVIKQQLCECGHRSLAH